MREISWLVGYEALADARLGAHHRCRHPSSRSRELVWPTASGYVPILRAGLGMVDAMLELMPTAQVWHLGLFRDERTLRPVEYYNKLPDQATVDLCLILDPMLATGGSATAAIEVLKQWGAVRIKLINLIAAPEGVRAVAIGPSRTWPSTARPSTASSTRRATSCPAWVTPATGSSARATASPVLLRSLRQLPESGPRGSVASSPGACRPRPCRARLARPGFEG